MGFSPPHPLASRALDAAGALFGVFSIQYKHNDDEKNLQKGLYRVVAEKGEEKKI